MNRPSNARLEIWVRGHVEPYIIYLPTDETDPPVVEQVIFRRYVEE